MNQNYRVVWSESANNWVAVQENATGRRQKTSRKSSARIAALSLFSMGLCGMSDSTEAASSGSLTLCTTDSSSSMGGASSSTIGWKAGTANCASSYSFFLGNNQNVDGSSSGTPATVSVMGGIDNTLVLTGTSGIVMKNFVSMSSNKIANMAAGTVLATSQDAVNGSQLYATNQSIAKLDATGTMYFHANSTGADSAATGADAIAIGMAASSDAGGAAAMGSGANAGGAAGNGNIAIGAGAQALTTTSGGDFHTGRSIALGFQANANSTSFGNNIAIGANATVSGMNGTALGVATSVSSDNGGVAVGRAASSAGDFASALGYGAVATTSNSVALGSFSSTAATVNSAGATIGGIAYAFAGSNAAGTVSIGSAGAERTLTNLAAGRLSGASTDAVNGSQLHATDQAVDQNTTDISNAIASINHLDAAGTRYFHANSTGAASTASGRDAVAIGTAAQASGASSIALGNGADARGVADVYGTTVAVGAMSTATANYSTALGSYSRSAGDASTALGVNATASGERGVALGASSGASGRYSTAIGTLSGAAGANAVALGTSAMANNANDVALGAHSTTAAVVNTTGATIAGHAYTFAGGSAASTVSVGSAGNERTMTNVAAGRVSSDSTDAVNGSQLYATNQAVNQNASDIRSAVDSIAHVTATGTKYFHVNSTGADSTAAGGNAIAVGQAATAGYAADIAIGLNATTNGGMTYPAMAIGRDAQAIATGAMALGVNALANVNAAIVLGYDSTASGNYATAIGANTLANAASTTALGGVSAATASGATALGFGAKAGNSNDVALGANSVSGATVNTTAATIGGNAYAFAGSNAKSTVSVGSAGAERTMTHVASGRILASSTDAVNGSQLYASNQAIDKNASDISNAVNSINTIVSTGTMYFHANSTGPESIATGLDSVAIGRGAVANNANDVALGSNSITSEAVATASIGISGVKYAFAGFAPVGTLSIGAAGAERTITNVAAGRISATSTDAVNGSQLHATNRAVSSLQTEVSNISTDVDALSNASVKYDINADGTPNTSSISLSGGSYDSAANTGGTAIHNVAYGADGGDAVNVDQLNEAVGMVTNVAQAANNPFMAADGNRDTEGAVASGTHSTAMGALAGATGSRATAIGSGATASAANAVALGANSVADRDNTVSVGSVDNERQVTHVAAGTQGTDAVNLSQMNRGISQGMNQANAYTDQRFTALGSQLSSVARGAYAGVAAATALSMIPDVDLGKTIAVGVGTANYKGYQASALGASARVTTNVKLKLGAGFSAAGTAVGGGASYQW
jgi:autotransporter adhesin